MVWAYEKTVEESICYKMKEHEKENYRKRYG